MSRLGVLGTTNCAPGGSIEATVGCRSLAPVLASASAEVEVNTVKEADAEIDAPEVATTFEPPSLPVGTEPGTSNVQGVPVTPGKYPSAPVEQVETTSTPSKVNVTEEFGANPDPIAATFVAVPPLVGVSVSWVGNTENVAAAVVDRPAVAITFDPPSSPGIAVKGTVNLQGVPVIPGKKPRAPVEHVDGTPTPSNVNVTVESG